MRRQDLGGWIKSETVDIFLVLRPSNLLTSASFLPLLILPQPLLDIISITRRSLINTSWVHSHLTSLKFISNSSVKMASLPKTMKALQ